MDYKDEQELQELMRNISRGIKKHGIKKIIRGLKQINLQTEGDINDEVIDFVEKSVCSKIGVPRETLYSFDLRGEVTIARKICILVIRRNLPKISPDELGSHYNRSRQTIFNAEKEFKSIEDGKQNRLQIDILGILNDVDIKTVDFIKSLKKIK